MAVACTSRFSVLKIEETLPDEQSENIASSSNKTKTTKAPGNTKPAQNVQNNSKTKKKKKSAVEAAELQSLVFGTAGGSKPKNSNQNPQNQKKKVRGSANSNQWQEWKVKDDKFVTDVFEHEIQEALLMSKIEFEEKKEVLDVVRKESESEVSESKKKKKSNQKKEKQTTMTLDAFQNLLPSQLDSGNFDLNGSPENIEEKRVVPAETDFFDKIEEDAEKIIMKEHRMDAFKKHQPFIAEHARSLQYQEELEQKDKTIEELKVQVKQIQEELKGAKYRNKKLCHILSHGEIRDKAEILVQVDQLTQVRDELTEEVQQLHAALEQERSKVHSLQMEIKKQGHRKEAKDAKDAK